MGIMTPHEIDEMGPACCRLEAVTPASTFSFLTLLEVCRLCKGNSPSFREGNLNGFPVCG